MSLIINLYFMIHLHLLLLFLLLDVTSSPLLPRADFSLKNIYLYLASDSSTGTLITLCVVDAACVAGREILEMMVTCTPRVSHVLVLLVSLKSLQLLAAPIPLLSSLLHLLFASLPLPLFTTPSQFLTYYLLIRGCHLLSKFLYRVFSIRSGRTLLPGAAYSVDERLEQEFGKIKLPEMSDELKNSMEKGRDES